MCDTAKFVVREVVLHVISPSSEGVLTVYCVSCDRIDHRQFCSVAGAAFYRWGFVCLAVRRSDGSASTCQAQGSLV